MRVELPTKYNVEYPSQNLKYYAKYSKPKMAERLYRSCKGYCMYCGKSVHIEGDKIYHLEHSVDKKGNGKQENDPDGVLEHCKYNLAISCPECNEVCKKLVDKINLAEFGILPGCPAQCNEMCDMFFRIREAYMEKNAIILQPLGKDLPIPHQISYDLLKHIYVPNCSEGHENVLFFVQNHIDRFELNGRRFSQSIIEICCKIVSWHECGIKETDKLLDALKADKPLNVVGIKFIEFIFCNFANQPLQGLIDFCRLLVILDAVP